VLRKLPNRNVWAAPRKIDGRWESGKATAAVSVAALTNPPGGLGFIIGASNKVFIATVIAGTAAARAELCTGDLLLNIDGKPVAGLPLEAVALRLRGAIGSTVTLVVAHPESQPREIQVTREVVPSLPERFRF
jgi:C-terminal processing protease CtpA/Prc